MSGFTITGITGNHAVIIKKMQVALSGSFLIT